jgi:hypothetical protein
VSFHSSSSSSFLLFLFLSNFKLLTRPERVLLGRDVGDRDRDHEGGVRAVEDPHEDPLEPRRERVRVNQGQKQERSPPEQPRGAGFLARVEQRVGLVGRGRGAAPGGEDARTPDVPALGLARLGRRVVLRLFPVVTRVGIVVALVGLVALRVVGCRRRGPCREEVAVLSPQPVLLWFLSSGLSLLGLARGQAPPASSRERPEQQRRPGPRGDLRDLSRGKVLELVVGDLHLAGDLEAEGLLA